MNKRNQLNIRLKKFNRIITEIIQLRNYIIYVQKIKLNYLSSDNDMEIFNSINEQYNLNQSLLIINLFKLIDPSNKVNLTINKIYNSLINEFRNQIKFDETELSRLSELNHIINNSEKIIDNISKQRSKFYAHSDLNANNSLADLVSIEWDELFKFIDLICEFCKIIKLEFIAENFFIKDNFSFSRDHILYYKIGPYSFPETQLIDLSLTLKLIFKDSKEEDIKQN